MKQIDTYGKQIELHGTPGTIVKKDPSYYGYNDKYLYFPISVFALIYNPAKFKK
jgi:hypothetical protein